MTYQEGGHRNKTLLKVGPLSLCSLVLSRNRGNFIDFLVAVLHPAFFKFKCNFF